MHYNPNCLCFYQLRPPEKVCLVYSIEKGMKSPWLGYTFLVSAAKTKVGDSFTHEKQQFHVNQKQKQPLLHHKEEP